MNAETKRNAEDIKYRWGDRPRSLGHDDGLRGALNLARSAHDACIIVDNGRFPSFLALVMQLEHGNGANVHTDGIAVAFATVDYHTNHDSTPLEVERVRRHKLISSWSPRSLTDESR